MFDPCGRASGSYKATAGKGEFTDTKYAKLGDLGSRVLPKYDTGTVWEAGSVVEHIQRVSGTVTVTEAEIESERGRDRDRYRE